MKIGGVELSGRVVLGPMAGVTTLAYREFMKPFGVALSYSEMISDCGLAYGNLRTFDYLATSPLDRPVGLQLFGSELAPSLKAVGIMEEKAQYDFLDLNFGCPVYKVVKTGAGSAWLKRPNELFEYVSAIVAASHTPVTAKIRLGWDDDSINVFEVASLLQKAGVSLLSVHARTSRQGYAGTARYEAIAGLKESLSIPLCISGDINSLEDVKKALALTHADFVMVARGGLGNPNLVRQIDAYLKDGSILPDSTLEEQLRYAREFAVLLLAEKGEKVGTMELRGLLPHFFKGFPGFKKIRGEISANINSSGDLWALLDGIERRSRC